MATGAYDANGIWNYGEDDNIALFSDLLNLATESTSDAFTDDRARLATLEAGSLSGLIPVAPTSVDKSGGTSSVTTLGLVTFSGVSSVSLNGVFTSNYSRYRINLNGLFTSVNALINFRGRTSGTDFTGANYYWSYGYSRTSGAAPVGQGAGSESKATLGQINSPGYSGGGGWIEIDKPKASANKVIVGQIWGSDGTGMINISAGSLIFNTASFDGFTIYPASGTLSGDIQVFGFND